MSIIKNINFFKWLTVIGALALIYTAAVTQVQRSSQKKLPEIIRDSIEQQEDSVEIVGTPTGDNPWKEIEKLVKAYYQKNGVYYKGTIKVIDDNQDTEKVLEEQPFEYSIINNSYYYRLGQMEVINKKDLLLAVDNENKTVSFSRNGLTYKANKPFDIRTFKKIMEKATANAIVTQQGEEKIITIDHIGDPDIQGYRIYYSPKTYQIIKMLIGMLRLSPLEEDEAENIAETQQTDNSKNTGDNSDGINTYYYFLQVEFSDIKYLSTKEKDFSPENKFIQLNNDTIKLTPAYNQYQLLNTIEQ